MGLGAPSEWLGRGAAEYGLEGEIRQEDMVRVLSGITPDGEDISQRGGQNSETRRFGEELTISAPKSVSLVAIEDERVVAAHQAAVREAVAYVEREMVYARIGKGGGKGSEFTGCLVAGRYTHEDSRPDAHTGRVAPHLHDHVVIANLTKRSDGQWTALKLDWGHENQKKLAADAVYKAALAKNLQSLGYEIERGKGANFEIAGITREQIEHFSPRSETIKREIGGDRSEVSAKAREAVQNRTRERKATISQEQRFEWRRAFREQGLDLAALRKQAEGRAAGGVSPAITAEQALKSAIRHLGERDTTFSRDQLRQEALAAGLGHVSPKEIEHAIEQREGGLVAAGEGKGLKSELFTTRAAVLREAEILRRARDGKGKAEAIIN
ncbi:MAG: MobF family relaxase, partial [Candidatus Igneacidithiobacillus chanchocoensis]